MKKSITLAKDKIKTTLSIKRQLLKKINNPKTRNVLTSSPSVKGNFPPYIKKQVLSLLIYKCLMALEINEGKLDFSVHVKIPKENLQKLGINTSKDYRSIIDSLKEAWAGSGRLEFTVEDKSKKEVHLSLVA